MNLDRVLLVSAAALTLAVPAVGRAATPQAAKSQVAQKAPATATPPVDGPKVHASKSKDITDCTTHTRGGPRSVAGLGLGTLVGSKLGGGATGIVTGAYAAGAVGEAIDRKARCGPSADIESNAAVDEAPQKKKKFSLGGLLGQ